MTGRAARQGDMSSADKIKVVDTNQDGILTADEHMAGASVMFMRMDTNKDGYLTREELAAGHAQMLKRAER